MEEGSDEVCSINAAPSQVKQTNDPACHLEGNPLTCLLNSLSKISMVAKETTILMEWEVLKNVC